MPIKLVAIDHDGVMMDSNWLVFRALWDLMTDDPLFGSNRRRIPNFQDFLRSFYLPGDGWLKEFGFDFSSEQVTEAVKHAPAGARMFPMVSLLLARVQEELQLPLIMISAGDQLRIEKQLNNEKVRNRFRLVVGGSLDKTMALALFCSALDVSPAETVYIGDMPSDMKSGRAAGVTTIGFTDDRPMMGDALIKAGARYCVRNHGELGELLARLACQ